MAFRNRNFGYKKIKLKDVPASDLKLVPPKPVIYKIKKGFLSEEIDVEANKAAKYSLMVFFDCGNTYYCWRKVVPKVRKFVPDVESILLHREEVSHEFSVVKYDPKTFMQERVIIRDFEHYKEFSNIKEYSTNRDQVWDSIYLNGDKLIINRYSLSKGKKVGQEWEKTTLSSNRVTFNLKTGDFYLIDKANRGVRGGGAQRAKIRKNVFRGIEEVKFTPSVVKLYNTILKGKLNLKTEFLSGKEYVSGPLLAEAVAKLKGFKVNDNFACLLARHYPTMKELRKDKFNVTNTLIRMFGFEGKRIKKFINTHDGMCLNKLDILYRLLRTDIFNEIPLDRLQRITYVGHKVLADYAEKESMTNQIDTKYGSRADILKLSNEHLSVSEQRKMIKAMEYGIQNIEFIDHLKMKIQLEKEYGFKIKISCRNREEFEKEHELFSKLIDIQSSKEVTTIDYTEDLLEAVSLPIEHEDEVYIPTLLKSGDEYKNEGKRQNHCVGGYIRSLSHIISIEGSGKRYTIEYSYEGFNRQSRGKSNSSPDEKWMEVIKILDERVKNLIAEEILLPKVVTTITLTHQQLIERTKRMISSSKTTFEEVEITNVPERVRVNEADFAF